MARSKKVNPASLSIPFEEYQALVGKNWSTVKHARRSLAHYHESTLAPPEDKSTLMLGRAAHTAILEPDDFPRRYAIFTGARRQGADWEAFKEAHVGRTILKETEYAEALAIRDAVRGHKAAAKLLSGGEAERSIVWTDKETGLVCKGRLDYLRKDGFVDVKRTARLELRRFQSTAWDLGHYHQAAWYRRGVVALTGLEPEHVHAYIVAVEGSRPFDVAPFEVERGALALADQEITGLLAKIAEAEKRKKWPGAFPDLQELEAPAYVYTWPEDTGSDEDAALGLSIPAQSVGGVA